MCEFNIRGVGAIINDGNFDDFVGKSETDFLDCKQEIYNLSNDKIKSELAKDISSFANLNGGYILIGVKTDKSENSSREKISEIMLLNQDLINTQQYFDTIKEWIYPEIKGLQIYCRAGKNNNNKGIGVIYIPPQKETLKPFLIKKVIDSDIKHKEIIFGYIQRKGESNEPKKIKDIHSIIRDGLLYAENIDNRFNALEAIIKDNLKHIKENNENNKNIQSIELINKRIKSNLQVNEMNKGRAMVLIAYPRNSSAELQSIFSNSEESIKKKLENPPTTRYEGWNLATFDNAKIIEGNLIRVQNGDRKIIDLHKDGSLIFSSSIDEDFIAWKSPQGDSRINSLALIEVIYNFILFYKEVLDDLSTKPKTFSIQCWLSKLWLDDIKTYIIPGKIDGIAYRFNDGKKPAQKNEYLSHILDYAIKDFNVGKIAYDVIKEIYLWFGITLDEGNIPYTKQENSLILIDAEQIKNIR